MKVLVAGLIAAVLLSGCSSMGGMTRLQAIAAAQTECRAYGFKDGSDNYAQCVMLVDQRQQERDQTARDGIRERLHRLGAVLAAGAPQQQIVTCNQTATVFGGVGHSTTTCM